MEDLTRTVAGSVRRARLAQGLSLSRTAELAGISRTTLTQLESGRGNPTVETVWALSQALGVAVGSLLQPEATTSPVVVRQGDGARLAGSTMDVRLLAQPSGMAHVDILNVRVKARAPRKSDPHLAGTVEHVMVRSGELVVGPVDDPVELTAGDYASFPGSVPHLYLAPAGDVEAIILICYPLNMSGRINDEGRRESPTAGPDA